MTLEEFNETNPHHKHFKIKINDEEMYKALKSMLHSYRKISLNHYETFKRVALLYYLRNKNYETGFYEDLMTYFNIATGKGKIDIVKDALVTHKYVATHYFPTKFLDPTRTPRIQFELELLKHLKYYLKILE
jgi:hypothetical protein